MSGKQGLRSSDRDWVSDWRFAAASVTGAGHLERSVECQDSFLTNVPNLMNPVTLARHADGLAIICVADGLGTSEFSAAGSAMATTAAQMCAGQLFADVSWTEMTLDDLFDRCRRLLQATLDTWTEAVAAISASSPNDSSEAKFRSTLIVVIMHPPWFGMVQVGDGLVVLEHDMVTPVLVSRYGVRASPNVTNYLSRRGVTEAACDVFYEEAITGIAVSTDGLQDSVLQYRTDRMPLTAKPSFFAPIFQEVGDGSRDSRRMMTLLRSPSLTAQADDDLTCVVVARRRPAVNGE